MNSRIALRTPTLPRKAALASLALALLAAPSFARDDFTPASALPDLSGLTPVGPNLFLAVHDAKNPDELDRPRVSLLQPPTDLEGVLWKPLRVDWNGLESNDLESAARIPGTNDVLLCESGDSGNRQFRRIYRARFDGSSLSIEQVVPWPVPVYNVEATAVALVGGRYVFLYAERAQNRPGTLVRWAPFDPRTMDFGAFRSARLRNPDPNTNRPLVALDVDEDGWIVMGTAFDAEAANEPNPDNGPFTSSVWRIGRISARRGNPIVRLDRNPTHLATLDGFKVESVAVVSSDDGLQLWVGFDDENYGSTLRQLPTSN